MERDFPIGHPAAVDYNGAKYTGPRAPWQDDFPADSPCRGGANTNATDTPDGMRAAHQAVQDAQAEAVTAGPLEPEHIEDFARKDSKSLLEQQAREYLKLRGYTGQRIDEIISQYGIDAVLADKAANTTA